MPTYTFIYAFKNGQQPGIITIYHHSFTLEPNPHKNCLAKCNYVVYHHLEDYYLLHMHAGLSDTWIDVCRCSAPSENNIVSGDIMK